MEKITITGQIEELAFQLLKNNPEGIRWSELNSKIKEVHPTFHPKTINGTVWKLTQKYSDKITKVDGVFRLVK